MKKLLRVLLVLFVVSFLFNGVNFARAETEREEGDGVIYSVYDGFTLLCERWDVIEGDEYLSYDFKLYKIVSVDRATRTAQATFVRQEKKPEVRRSKAPSQITTPQKTIGMYITHNDESYIPTDGVSSIYGAGGIHDVAKEIQWRMKNRGINVILDEALHIPHDGYAYTRSSATAKKLLNEHSLDAIFDIHRDGASRSSYVTQYSGQEKCHVRLVVGKSSTNYNTTYEFAMYLLSVGQEMYPWLFKDIYLASGHYNQGLSPKALLFEMGCHLVEKELVIASVPALVAVIDTALYSTTIDPDDGKLTINGNATDGAVTINEYFSEDNLRDKDSSMLIIAFIFLAISGSVLLSGVIYTFLPRKKI